VIDHAKPRGTSRQLYKGLVAGRSRAVFNGRIFVRQDAQQTDAHQTNKTLLLSDGASVDTKPQLEISADDVRCTHGAAAGALDETQLFYLKSRGLEHATAQSVLAHGFVREVIHGVSSESLRAYLDALVSEGLEREFSLGERRS
jgi:Fe-S cluster assembly protein SufD